METKFKLVVNRNEQENLGEFVCKMETPYFIASLSYLRRFFRPNLDLLEKRDDPFFVYLFSLL